MTSTHIFKKGETVTYMDHDGNVRKGTVRIVDSVSFRDRSIFVYHIRRNWSIINDDIIAEKDIVDPSMLDKLLDM